jgi:hypothetical protein
LYCGRAGNIYVSVLENYLDLILKESAVVFGFLVTIIPPECTKSVELFEDRDIYVCAHLSYLRNSLGFKLKYLSLNLRENSCLCSFALYTVPDCFCSFILQIDLVQATLGYFYTARKYRVMFSLHNLQLNVRRLWRHIFHSV